ncbi:MAG: AMP-binding protein, partial [Microthrixaceae bacterium]|nr:AMP-binding protein [Microthrixaceae bacterium]
MTSHQGGSVSQSEPTIENYQSEERTFPPPPEFVAQANLSDPEIYDRAAADPEAFWADIARNLITWRRDFDTTLQWELPYAKWFVGGKLNVTENCLDRHVDAGLGDRVAYHWEGEPGDTRTITYAQLLEDVSRLANVLRGFGVEKGDRVVIYLPMIPELPMSLLACARIGAIHSVIFGGFSPDSIIDRVNDAEAKVVITADAGFRKGKPSALKPNVDTAMERCPTVEKVLVVDRCGTDVTMVAGRDVAYAEAVAAAERHCEPEEMDSEDPLYILYTSGTTAKPKGIVHTTGGYLTQVAWTTRQIFDLKPESDTYWCAADVGWVTGHSYITYGPLAAGATEIVFEGVPTYPNAGRFWQMIERHKC